MTARLAPLAVAVALAACASAAPALPIDRTAINGTQRPTMAELTADEAAMTCARISDERARDAAAIRQANANIEANRSRNQTAAFMASTSTLLLPALLVTEGNYADKDTIRDRYAALDRLNLVGSAKGCASSP